jgi:glutamine synthetase
MVNYITSYQYIITHNEMNIIHQRKGGNMDVKDIQEKISAANIDSLRIDFPDLHGICRSKLVPAGRLEEVLEEGCNHVQATYAIDFANDVAMGTGAGDEIQWRDMTVKPDLDTFAVLPHLEGTARFIGNAYGPDGNRLAMDPRYVLQRVLKRYEDLNLNPMAASELEFFLFNQGGEADGEVYNASPSCVYQVNPIIDPKGILRTLQNTFIELGLDIIYINHEFFPGQFEVNWKYDHALKMADQTFTFKYVCKEVAAMNDLLLTFMGRPKTDNGGSGYHIHASLFDPKSGNNIFEDPDGEHGVSDQLRYFLGGQMAHAKGMSAILAPTINSYRRFVLGAFCPFYLAWGWDNRTVYCRVPAERGSATRVENRGPCASANPYLVMAAILAAGLDGIENKIEPGEPAPDDVYGAEPGTLETVTFWLQDALEDFKADQFLCDALGPELVQAFLAVKEHEIERFRTSVTDWEFNEYAYHL